MTKHEIIFFRPCNAFSAVWCLIAHPGGALSPSHSLAAQWEVLAWEKTPHSCSQWETSAELYSSPGTGFLGPSSLCVFFRPHVHLWMRCRSQPGSPLSSPWSSLSGGPCLSWPPLEILPWAVSGPHCSVQCLLRCRANCNSPQSRSLSLLLATKANFSPPTQSRK